jgi:hypothetical protein
MSSTIALENPPTFVGGENDSNDEFNPIGNIVYTFEVSNVFVGCVTEFMEDIADSHIATLRMGEESEPMDKVFSELGIG